MARWNWLGAMVLAASAACGGTTVKNSSNGTTGGASLPAGSPCTSNDQCFSQICGLDGTGNCCTSQCTSDGTACGIADCDATGACIKAYAGTSCDTCASNVLTPGACNGTGTCETGIPNPCPGDLVCNASGTACEMKCSADTDCGTGFHCNAGVCVAKIAVGACTADDACLSSACGIAGSGHCCTTACANTSPPCGATDCDAVTGACLFPDSTVVCGSVSQSCSGSASQSNASLCDGAGGCPTPGMTDCAPYVCSANACLTTCSDATSCAPGDFCDTTRSACCASLTSGSTLTVDALAGSDKLGCCGIGGNQPCQTLTHAMQLIDLTQASDVTIVATVADGGRDWAPPGEKYPIVLGWGVELNAPGIYFFDPPPGGAGSLGTFVVQAYSTKDTVGYASIAGTATKQIGVGMSEDGTVQSLAYSAIQVDPGQTLYIANAYVNGNASALTDAITVLPGGSLVLGQDKSASVTGTVNIGNGLGSQMTDGYDGILCKTDNVKHGCTITDAALFGQNSVIIQGQEGADLIIQDFSAVSLTSHPIVGISPAASGFHQCNNIKPDGSDLRYPAAINLDGKSSMTLVDGAIHCVSAGGIAMVPTLHGTPTLMMTGTTISNTETALEVQGGTATVWDSFIGFNYNGIVQASLTGSAGGIVNLNGGLDGGTDGGTTVICSSNSESIYGENAAVGVNVLNETATPLIATNVSWDTSGPDHFHCGSSITNCYCTDAGPCTNIAGENGMDAVTENGPVVTTGNTQSALAVGRGCQ